MLFIYVFVFIFSSCVSFGPRNRSIGVSARQQINSNLKNTVINFKHLIGRKYSDEHTQRIKEFVPCDVVQLPDDNIGLKVFVCHFEI